LCGWLRYRHNQPTTPGVFKTTTLYPALIAAMLCISLLASRSLKFFNQPNQFTIKQTVTMKKATLNTPS
jgi:hypothetical protein